MRLPSPNLTSHALARLNGLPEQEARVVLQGCCGSRRWAARVAGGRPYADAAAVYAEADVAWDAATAADVREAIAAHPRTGEPQTGGEELLADLRARLRHAPTAELVVAAEAQRAITRLRLERLLAG